MGNPTSARLKAWEPQAGVFLETFRKGPGNANDWEAMRQMMNRSEFAFGAGYRPRIYDGFNPFGEPDNFVSVYRAWFRAPRAGRYTFATISDDASFLWVGDRMVCEWPGYHTAPAGQRGQFNGEIELTAGIHELRYYHVDFRQSQAMVAAWKPPGARAIEIMPAAAFVPIASCYVDELEDGKSPLAADFRVEQVEWLELEDFTYLLYRFHDASNAPGAQVASREWKFSDGTTYTGSPVEKLFLHKGQGRVTLTVKDAAGRQAQTTRPLELFAIDKMERSDLYDLTFVFLKALNEMPLDQLKTNDILAAAYLLRDQRRLNEASKLYRDFLERRLAKEKKLDVEILRHIVEIATEGHGTVEETESFLMKLLGRLDRQAPERAEVYFLLGRLQLDQMRAPDRALTSLQSARLALPATGDRTAERNIWIAIGDAHRARARVPEAREAYLQAEAIPLAQERRFDYDVSSYALTAEAHIRQGHLDEADAILGAWERKFPTERLVGYSSILKARVLAARDRRQQAAQEIETFLATKPQGVFLQNALLELGDIYAKMGRNRQAVEAYERLLREFEAQETREEVEKKLRQLNRGTRTPRR